MTRILYAVVVTGCLLLAGPSSAAPQRVPLTVEVLPWGFVTVDGVPVPMTDGRVATTQVAPGRHVVEVQNARSHPIRKVIVVAPTNPAPQLTVRLVPKPAQLVVRTEDDAAVRVQGVETRRPLRGQVRAVEVPMLGTVGEITVDIEVSAKNRRTRRFVQVLRAGETTVLDVILAPGLDGDPTFPPAG